MKLTYLEILNKALGTLKEKFACPDAMVQSEADRGAFDVVVGIMGVDFACTIIGLLNNVTFNWTLNAIHAMQEGETRPVLLVTKYINPAIMEQAILNNLNVLDCAGNCHIRYMKGGQMIFQLSNKGEKNVFTKERTQPAFQDAGIKVIFYLLQDDTHVNKPYRVIQENTGVSLGTVKNVIEELVAQRYVLISERGRFLKNKKKLLDQWVMSFNQVLKPKLWMGEMTFRDIEHKKKWAEIALPIGMCWGGESGASLLDGYLEPGSFDVYTSIPTANLLKTGYVMPDDGGEIRIYQRFWTWDAESNIAPILLIYADLMGSGESRSLEAAQRIAEHGFKHIK
ncbi:MAG: hypothetical protein LBN29_12040 [Mediterranea sp.]|jgi:hypothetical protein|nr:hypothetical protein [Mediterranea sp.]